MVQIHKISEDSKYSKRQFKESFATSTLSIANFVCYFKCICFDTVCHSPCQWCLCHTAGVVGVVVSNLALHRGDLGSIPGFGIQAVQIHA